MGKLTISTGPFSIANCNTVTNYRRVLPIFRKQLCPPAIWIRGNSREAINAINSPDHLTVLWKCGSNEPVSIWGSKTTKFETFPRGLWGMKTSVSLTVCY